jgi:Plasmid pRiA4b ORF-3-like protein
MGWEDYHLYEFEISNVIIALPDDDLFPSFREKYDAKKTKISKFFIEEGQKCTYTYDFGDYWQHTILLEKIETSLTPLTHPICLKGKRACPPEDIGGIYGYMHIVHMLNSTDADEEVEQFIEWYGGEYDPEYFNVEEVNERLKSIQL